MESREALVAPGSRYYNYTAGPAARDCLLTVKCVGRFTYLPGYALTRRSFDSYLLEVILDGALTLQTGGQDYPANRGDAVLLDCHTPHAYRSRQGWQALWLHFDGPGAAGYYRWITRGGSPVLHPADFAGLCGALGRIYRLFEAGLAPGEGLLAREVTAALGCLLDPGPGAAPDPLDQVLYAITANLDKEMTVRELADLAHFSEYHFIRLFRARVGMTPPPVPDRRPDGTGPLPAESHQPAAAGHQRTGGVCLGQCVLHPVQAALWSYADGVSTGIGCFFAGRLPHPLSPCRGRSLCGEPRTLPRRARCFFSLLALAGFAVWVRCRVDSAAVSLPTSRYIVVLS